MEKVPAPIITDPIRFTKQELTNADTQKSSLTDSKEELLFEYPVVYIGYDSSKKGYHVYVGETNDIEQRTQEHLMEERDDWQAFRKSDNTMMIVIGHSHFNKSLTLDIENTMMMYMLGVDSVQKLNNRRTNQQYKYFTSGERKPIFSKIWQQLHELNGDLFPIEEVIRDSAIFKASPFHKLTKEQEIARKKIFLRIKELADTNATGQLIMVEGEAGSGKTVLLSTLFYRLSRMNQDRNTKNYMLVNHDEQVKVYENIAKKLDLNVDTVSKPTKFINDHHPDSPVDVVLIDEAHLLWTQGKQSYRGKNQLRDIMKRAKVTVIIFDPKQILKTEGYLTANDILKLENHAQQQHNLIQLKEQLRIKASEGTIIWLRHFIDQHVVLPIPNDSSYDLKIFDDAQTMYQAIQQRAATTEHGLSRVVATFDWPYKNNDRHNRYMVTAGTLSLPWNLQIVPPRGQKNLPWAEQSQTINEVGSTFTIQGFDLNYAGVIIGPSVKYRDGQLIFDPSESYNKRATNHRTLANGKKVDVHNELLANELNVLMTRGVHGLYIYAVDDQLRQALLNAENQH